MPSHNVSPSVISSVSNNLGAGSGGGGRKWNKWLIIGGTVLVVGSSFAVWYFLIRKPATADADAAVQPHTQPQPQPPVAQQANPAYEQALREAEKQAAQEQAPPPLPPPPMSRREEPVGTADGTPL